jgi:hypothetical protein
MPVVAGAADRQHVRRMNMTRFGEWQYTCDREATADAYRRATAGGSRTCNCAGCRNFVAAGLQVFPSEFLKFLESLGIDPTKDGEVYHIARLSPGRHIYGGWYHFVGVLDVTGDFAPVEFGGGFSSHLLDAYAPRIETLKDKPVVQVEFASEQVPWVLLEQELE